MKKISKKRTDSSDISFSDLLSIVNRHKNLLILISGVSFLIAFYYTYTVTPVYTSSTSIMINSSKTSPGVMFDLTGSSKMVEIENEKLLIKSRVVAEATIKKLVRDRYHNGYAVLGSRQYMPKGQKKRRMLKEILTLGFYEDEESIFSPSVIDTLDIATKYSNAIQNSLSITNQRNSDILVVSFSSPFPEESAIVANAIAYAYKNIDNYWSNRQSLSILTFIEEQSSEIERDLTLAEEKLKNFKENKGIYDLSGNSELLLSQLIDAEGKYNNTKAEINISQERKKFLSSTLSNQEKTLADKLLNSMNAKLLALRTEISQKESELVKNSTLHGDKHAAVIQLEKEISALKEKLDIEAEILIEQGLIVSDPVKYRQDLIEELLVVGSELMSLTAKAEEYEKLTTKYNEKLNLLPSLQLSYARLERDRSVLNQTYLFMRQKLEESRIQVASASGKVQIIDKAVPPISKTSPNHKRNLAIGLIVGLIIGLALTILIEYFDKTIKSIDDIFSELTILGIIPAISENHESHHSHHSNRFSYKYFKRRFLYYKKLFFNKGDKEGEKNISTNIVRHLITHEQPKSPISEAYRSLRTSISYSSSGQFFSMVVSSAGPGEGKTTSIANLAITYANLGKKVLLVDTDLRRPVLNKVFDKVGKDGITSYLSGNIDIDNVKSIIYETGIANLYIIPSGIIPPNPSELLESKKMSDLITTLKNDWDIVLFDSPPLFAVTDASLIAKHTDKLMLVVMPGKTDKNAFNHCVDNLNNMNQPIDGIVLNGVNSKNSYGSYYYYYQYYNYYGQKS